MADDELNELVEGRDAAGWKQQWDALKQELDELNPRTDKLTNSLALADAECKLQRERAELADQLIRKLQAESQACQDALATVREARDQAEMSAAAATTRVNELTAANARHRDHIAACFAAIAPLHKALGESLATKD